jgi:PAS domain S-box-containing protein
MWLLAAGALLLCLFLTAFHMHQEFYEKQLSDNYRLSFYWSLGVVVAMLAIVFLMLWLTEVSRVDIDKSIAERESHFKQLAEAIGEVFWLADASKAKILYISPGYETIWGRSCESLYENAAAWLEPIHPDDRAALLKALPDQVRGSYCCEYRIIRPDGSVRWIEDRAFPIRDESGAVHRIAGLATDITHRKHIEQRLRQHENQLRQAARIARLGSWSWELRSNKIVMDSEVCKILELPPNTTMSLQKGLDMYPPRWRKVIAAAFDNCLEHGTAYDEELQIMTAGGRYLWVRTRGEAIRDDQGRIARLEGSFQDITEQKHTANLLAQGGQRLQQLANALPIIIWSATSDGIIDYVNDRFSEYTGVAPSQIGTQEDWLSVIHQDDQWLAGNAWQNATLQRSLYLTEFRLRDATGNYRWHLARAVPVFNAQHEIVRWYGSAIDIHDTKTNEEKAQALADRLTVTLESITDAFVTMDTEWRFTYINQEAEQILHRSRAELLGQTMWQAFPQTINSDFEFHYKKAVTTGEKASFEAYYAPLKKWFSVNAYPSSEGLAVYFQDITLRRENEQQLRLMEACIAHMNDMVIITNAPRNDTEWPEILFVNAAFEKVMGYKQADVLHKNPRFLRAQHSSQEQLDKVRQALKTWQPVRAELTNSTKSGESVQVEMDLVPIADDSGKYTHWVAVERNITERKRIVELEQAHQLAELASQAKSNFLAAMSHEIRTPINGVIGMVEVLQQTHLRAYQTEMVDIIRDSAMSLLNIIEDILDFSKIESGRLELDCAPFSLREMLKKVIQLMEPVAVNSNVLLNLTIDEQLPEFLWGDEQRLRQVMLNLISNAIKFSSKQKRHGNVQVEVRLLEQQSHEIKFEMAVKDNGIGLSKESMEHLFTPFMQADASTSRHFGGTGLGLSITHGLTQLMKGNIRVISELGQGAEFIVQLQLPKHQSHLATLKRDNNSIAVLPGALQNAAPILVVEDNTTNQKVIAYQLGLLGYSSDIAANGAEALDKWRTTDYSLILTDLHMPQMDGYEFVKALRAEEQVSGKHIPIVALTANALRGEAERCRELGMDDYLTKPITLNSLALSLMKHFPHSAGFVEADSNPALPLGVDPQDSVIQVTPEFQESASVIDINVLRNLVGDDEHTLKDFLNDFLLSAQQLTINIEQSYKDNSWQALAVSAHTLKSSARAVGALALGDLCERLEKAAKQQQREIIAQQIGVFTSEFARVSDYVERYLQ